jgi:dipeptidyl aminopeptidase/acylaminoacyl peptidase
MIKRILFFGLLLFISFSYSQIKPADFILELRNPADFPFYAKITENSNGKVALKSKFSYVDSLNFYGIGYKSFDNLNLRGFLIEPKEKGNYPVLIFNRGGNGNLGTVGFGFMCDFLGKIASQGYVVIGSQLRGTAVSEGEDEFGGKDVNDVLSLLDIIDQLPNVDNKRIGTFGWSRGVMTSFLMLKKTNRIKTNIAIAGQADLFEMKRPEMFGVYRSRIPNYAKDSIVALKSRSSLLAIDSIQNKNLSNFIIHGDKDVRVDVENAFKLNAKLSSKKYTTRLLIYENEGHDLENVTDKLVVEIKNWLEKYL